MIHRRLFHQMKEHSLDMDAWMTQHGRSTPRLRNSGKSDTLHKIKNVVLQDLTPFSRANVVSVCSNGWYTPGMGVSLWDASPL